MSHPKVETKNIYLAGLHPVEEGLLWDALQREPIAGWQPAILESNKKLPSDLTNGTAIVVIGCAAARPLNHTETLNRLKFFMQARVWIAVAFDAKQVTQELCTAAGAAGYFTRPVNTAQLRDVIEQITPTMGQVPKPEMHSARVLSLCSIFRSNIYLRLQTPTGVSGVLALRNGQPFHATLSDGTEGVLALQTIIGWSSAKVFCLPLPSELTANMPLHTQPPAPANSVSEHEFTPAEMASGGTLLCDRLTQLLFNIQHCAVVDLEQKRLVGCPSLESPTHEIEAALVEGALGLLNAANPARSSDPIEDVVLTTASGWCAAYLLGTGSFAVIISGWGLSQSVLARSVIDEAIRDGVLAEMPTHHASATPSESATQHVAKPRRSYATHALTK